MDIKTALIKASLKAGRGWDTENAVFSMATKEEKLIASSNCTVSFL